MRVQEYVVGRNNVRVMGKIGKVFSVPDSNLRWLGAVNAGLYKAISG
jgi:hypothetical protein